MKTTTLLYRILLGFGVLLIAAFSSLPLIPPRAVSADAPATAFSAERAMADLEVIVREPHAAGSEAQARVRGYIIDEVAAISLQAELETKGQVTNILVLLPGTDSTGMVLVTGHYDSHPPAPGAGDNGISTAAMLESLRVLQRSTPLRNDVLFLFTDGEELGWLGAYAYLNAHPEAQDEIDMVLVFDARPGNAPLTMTETSPGDGWLIRQIGGLPLPLWAGSWNNREERTEMDTDFDVFQAAGFTGAVFENEASGTRYHTDRDTVDAISPGLVQAYGGTILALAGRLGNLDLRTRTEAPDLVFFTLPLLGIVSYPGWLMPTMSGLGLLVLLAFVAVAWRQGRFSMKRFGWSLLCILLGIVLIVLCAQLAWGGIKDVHAGELAAGAGFEASTAWLTGLMCAAIVLMVALLAILSRRLGWLNLLLAGVLTYLLVWIAVSALLDADNPFTTAYIAWPFLGGVAGMGVLLFTRNPIWKSALLAICALIILTLLVPQLWLATYTHEDAWIPVLAACIPIGLFAPQVDVIFGWSHAIKKTDQVKAQHK
jgi:hypothetical protein